MKERVDFLVDLSLKDNVFSYRIEQPRKDCPCGGTGRLPYARWVKDVYCGCQVPYDEFHADDDCTATVPCPFCAPESE